ncbi:MAG TPA: PIN domain-containing protein [Blastocatellia bacterium]|nr:PIN domain-containing protein [Blastocatellia bacterium]
MKQTIEPAFWDASALVPLCCHQSQTAAARQALRLHPKLVVWWATSVECTSALARLVRVRELTTKELQQSLRVLSQYRNRWTEIAPTVEIREQAEKLLPLHELRAADALQLAAALAWCKGFPKGRPFLCGDKHLSDAATKEGFTVTFLA